MVIALFYVALVALFYLVFSMTRMHNAILQHRHALVARLIEVTDALPAEGRDDWHLGNAQLLDAQVLELKALQPWWWVA